MKKNMRRIIWFLWSFSWASSSVFGQGVAGTPVTPRKVTIPVAPIKVVEPIGPMKTVPEGEPMLVSPPARQPIEDPVLQFFSSDLRKVLGLLTGPNVNIAGLSGGNPPDTTGDVGPNHYVQMVNATRFRVFDKRGNPLTGAMNFGNLFPAGDPGAGNAGDPIVVYDHLADRWVLSQFGNPNHMSFAISQTPDPTAGTWFVYTFNTTVFPDYPKIGVWQDGYYVSSYESPNLGIYVFDRANMLQGNAAGFVKTTISSLGAPGVRDTRILPADLDGPPPPAGTPGYFVRTVDDQQDPANPNDRIEIYEARVNWLSSTLTFTLVNTLTPAAFNIMTCNRNGGGIRDCVPQPNTTATVDALSNRSMMQLKYRNFGSYAAMVFNQTIDVSGSIPGLLGFTPANEVAGIRWYQLTKLSANWTIGQQGTFAPQAQGTSAEAQLIHRWMGSMAMDGLGNIGLGYNVVNDDNSNPVFPGIRFTGRRYDDPAGFLLQGERTIQNGLNSVGTNGAFGLRWGDYSQIGVDPLDDCTFWYTTHDANNNTRIASFNLASSRIVSLIANSGNFGNVCLNEFKDLDLTINNSGECKLVITALTSTSSEFVLPSVSNFPIVINPGDSLQVPIRFQPANLGSKTGNIAILSNDPNSPTRTVAVSGVAPGSTIATAVPNNGSFGEVCLGAYKDLDLTINNSGGCDLLINNISSSSTHFIVPGVLNFPLVLHPGDSLRVPLRFQPTSLGSKTGTFVITSNDPNTPTKLVSVSGSVPPGDIRVTGATDFGDVCAGATGEKILSICNAGKCDLRVSSVAFDPACPDFTLINNPFPATVGPGSCLDLVIRFTPSSCGPKTCTLRIASDDPDQPVVVVTVTANTPCPEIDVPLDLAFLPEVIQNVGSCTSPLPFPVSNKGKCDLTITAIEIGGINGGDFRIAGLPSFPIILQPGHIAGEGDLNVVFAPTAIDRNRQGTITVTYVLDPVTGTTTNVTRKLAGEGVNTGARVLVTQAGIPISKVERIHLQRINANRNRDKLDTQDSVRDAELITVVPLAPGEPFQYHREYGTISNPIQLLPGSYQVTVQAIINGKRKSQVVGFDVQTCDFNPTVVVDFP